LRGGNLLSEGDLETASGSMNASHSGIMERRGKTLYLAIFREFEP